MSPITYNLTEPYVAVHGHKKRTLMNACRLGMYSYGGIDKIVPYLGDFGLTLALIEF